MTKFGMCYFLPFTTSKGEMIPLDFSSTYSYLKSNIVNQTCKLQLPMWSGLSEKEVDKMSGRNKLLDPAV